MIMSIEASKDLMDWMVSRGLGLGEAARVLGWMECGDTFALALMRVFHSREQMLESLHENYCMDSCPDSLPPELLPD